MEYFSVVNPTQNRLEQNLYASAASVEVRFGFGLRLSVSAYHYWNEAQEVSH